MKTFSQLTPSQQAVAKENGYTDLFATTSRDTLNDTVAEFANTLPQKYKSKFYLVIMDFQNIVALEIAQA